MITIRKEVMCIRQPHTLSLGTGATAPRIGALSPTRATAQEASACSTPWFAMPGSC
jgi:hypothetical protein